MSRKGENIYKRKDGRWEGRYIRFYGETGNAKYGYVYGKSYGETKKRLLDRKSADPGQATAFSSLIILYNEVLDAWLQSRRIHIKESTYACYSNLIETHIRPILGKYQLPKISTQRIESFIESKINHGRLDGAEDCPKKLSQIS